MDHVSVLKALRDEARARIEAAKRAIDEGLDGKMVASLDALISDLETPTAQQTLEPVLAPPQPVAEIVDVPPGNEVPPPLAEPLPPDPSIDEVEPTELIALVANEEFAPTPDIPVEENAPAVEIIVAEYTPTPEMPSEESALPVGIPVEEHAPTAEIPAEEFAPAAPEPPARPYTPSARSSSMAYSPGAELLVEEFDPDLPLDRYSANVEQQQQFAPDWLTGDDDTPVEIPIEDYTPSEISAQEPAPIEALPLETLPVMEVSQLEAILDPIPLDLPLLESPPALPSRVAAPISELPTLLSSPDPSGTGLGDELLVLKLVPDETRE